MRKITIIGSGNVGSTAAFLIAGFGLADVVLLDIIEGVPQGKALDMSQAVPLMEAETSILGTNDYADIADSDVVVVTAGLPRRPGMSRLDLLEKNGAIITQVVEKVNEFAPNAIMLIVTNPLDVMVYLAYRKSGRPKERVIGMGGLLDSARWRYFLSVAANVPVTKVGGIVIGAHGNTMVPLASQATISGRPATELIKATDMESIVEKTKHGGAEIVGLLKTGSAFYAPGTAIFTMVKAIINDEKRLISTCCLPGGEYGQSGLFLNLPAVIGAGGLEKIVELDISASEKKALELSAAGIKKANAEFIHQT